jgi:hypothetical protein
MRAKLLLAIGITLLAVTTAPAATGVTVRHPNAVVNNSATPASVLAYLNSIAGNHIVSGQHNAEPNSNPLQYTNQVHAITGEFPGLWGGDFLFEADSIAARQTMVDEAKAQWANGSLVTLMWHECPPTIAEPCDWTQVESVNGALTTAQWQQLVTDGSALNTAWKNELNLIVPFLRQLKDAGIPILWRPLHEINDGWSWWGGTPNTAALWRLTYDYLVNAQGLTNLIWVWSVKDSGSTSNLGTYYPGRRRQTDRAGRGRRTADAEPVGRPTEVDVLQRLGELHHEQQHQRADPSDLLRRNRAAPGPDPTTGQSDRSDHRLPGPVPGRPSVRHRQPEPGTGLHLQRDQRPTVDRRAEQHADRARQVP